jgi:diguanylate cyclase (GGDEF)-like protein
VGNVLIANPDSGEGTFLVELAGKQGDFTLALSGEQAMFDLRSKPFEIVFVDADLSRDPSLRSHLPMVPCVILTGRKKGLLEEASRTWPFEQFVDHVLISADASEVLRSRRVVRTAWDYAKLKSAVSELKTSKDIAENRLRQISEEIRGLGSSLTANLAQELEKRIAAELRYRKFQKLKEGIEDTLRRLYSADDVNNLLDAVFDIKDLLLAEGISIYLAEENGRPGIHLKPLVWDNAIPDQTDPGRNIVPLGAADFASFVARTGGELCIARPEEDKRFSARYRELMRVPLRGLLAAPLTHGGSVIGLIEVYNKVDAEGRPADFGPDDQRILHGLSEHMSLAITNLNLIQYDALTGLLRPDPFFEKAVHKLEVRSKRRLETGPWAMIMGDVDWFKLYNDRNGHEAGNRLLRELAGLLKSSIREEDLLCRYGGEEFLFLLCGVESIEEATMLTERIREMTSQHHFENEEFQPRGNLTMSFGVTLIDPVEDLQGEPVTKDLLKKLAGEADLALAEAKGMPRPGLSQISDPAKTRDRVCAFVRKKSAILSPTALLDIPSRRSYIEKRRHARYFASTLCIYRENGHHRVVPTVDLSLGGAKLSSQIAFPLTRPIEMFLILGSQAQRISGDVIYSQKVSAESSYFYSGVRFRDLSEEERRIFEDFFQDLGRPDALPS